MHQVTAAQINAGGRYCHRSPLQPGPICCRIPSRYSIVLLDMAWSLFPEKNIGSKQDHWQHVNETYCNNHPLLHPNFVLPLVKHFGEGNITLAIQYTGDSPTAAVLLRPTGVGRWETFLPAQAAFGSIMVGPPQEPKAIAESLHSLLKSLKPRAWRLDLLKQDPDLLPIADLAQLPNFSMREYGLTTSVNTTGEFDDFWAARQKRLRKTIGGILRRLEKSGQQVELRRISEPADMAAAVRAHGDLEIAGWKGRSGTAIGIDNLQGRFYLDLLGRFSEERSAAVFQLLIDGKVAASLINVLRNGMLVVLKTAYDEELKRVSPGRVLDYLMLKAVFLDPSITVVENYTNAAVTDRYWVTDSRPMSHMSCFSMPAAKKVNDIASWVATKVANRTA